MSEQLGIGQIIKNFLGIGDDDKEPSGAVSSSLRPKARPEGLMSSPRPKARPEDTDDDDTPSTNEDVVTNTITMMNDYDDSEDEVGVPLDSANIQELLINPNSLYDRHSTTIRRLSKFGNEVPTVMKQKLRSPVVNDLLVDVTAMLAKEQSANRPPEEPEFIDVPKPIPVTLNNREIQEKLVDAGYNITVDGVVGPQTKKAIKAFQKEKGLKVDGVVGKNTTAALAGVPEIKVETLEPGEVIYDDDFLAQQELASVEASNQTGLMARPGIRSFDPFKGLLDFTLVEDEIDLIPEQKPNVTLASMVKGFLRFTGITKEVEQLNPIEKVESLGYIKGMYKDFLLDPRPLAYRFLSEKTPKIIADIKDNRYGGYIPNLSEKNPEDAKVIEGFFKQAIGPTAKFDAAKEAWCALFVDHILNEMGADRLEGDSGYDRVRARAYENYGEGVLGRSPNQKDFNANAKVGDILVIHSSYKITKPNGRKAWLSTRKVEKDNTGKYNWIGDPDDDINIAEVAKMNDGSYSVTNQYHVGFNVGKAKNGMLTVLGGNQNDQVNVRGDAYPIESIMAVRRITPKTIEEDIN